MGIVGTEAKIALAKRHGCHQVFLAGRGYGVSQEAAIDAAGRVEMAGCSLPVLERELEGLALVM